jgi:signal peptidase I
MANFENETPTQLADPIEQAPDDTTPRADAPTADPAPVVHKSVLREYFESIVVTFIMALFGMTFITQAVKVPTGSMLNTILVEDHLMVNKFLLSPHPSWLDNILPYRSIRRGDIIVFKYPENPEENYVKRVIGLPGDEIRVRGTKVLINGHELPENKVFASPSMDLKADLEPAGPTQTVDRAAYTVYFTQTTEADDRLAEEEDEDTEFKSLYHASERSHYATEAPYVVPQGHYFCLGDNRDNSLDSRFWGPVPRENVVGRAMFVYWSIDESAREEAEPGGFLADMFRYTRWNRSGTLIK